MAYGWDVSTWNLVFVSAAPVVLACGPDDAAVAGDESSGTASVSVGEVGSSTGGPDTPGTTGTATTPSDTSTSGDGPCTEDADCDPSLECARGECVPRKGPNCYYGDGPNCCQYGDGFGGCADCEAQEDCGSSYPVCMGTEPVGYCGTAVGLGECFEEVEPVLIPMPDTSMDGATSLAFVDADADAPQDLVAVVEGEVRLMLGPASAPATTLEHGTGLAEAVVGGDFDGDGNDDIAVSTTGPEQLTVLLGDGDGSFALAASTGLPAAAPTLVAGDFDDDGSDDIGALAGQQLAVLFSDGAGGFSDPLALAPDSIVTSVTTGDMNDDGRVDLVFDLSGEVAAWLGNASGDATVEPLGDGALFTDATVTVAARQLFGDLETRIFAQAALAEYTVITQWSYPSPFLSNTRELSGQFLLAAGLRFNSGGPSEVLIAGPGGVAVLVWDNSDCRTPVPVRHPVDTLATGDIDGDGLDEVVVAGPRAISIFDFQ